MDVNGTLLKPQGEGIMQVMQNELCFNMFQIATRATSAGAHNPAGVGLEQ